MQQHPHKLVGQVIRKKSFKNWKKFGSEPPPGSTLKVQPQTLMYLSKRFGPATRFTFSIAVALGFVVTTSS